jgi:hypothetical protein
MGAAFTITQRSRLQTVLSPTLANEYLPLGLNTCTAGLHKQLHQELCNAAQAFGPEEELTQILQDVELAANRFRKRLPVPVLSASGITELPVLAPMLLQQAEAMERAAAVAAANRTDPPPSSAPEFKFFVKEGTTCAPCHSIAGPHAQFCW